MICQEQMIGTSALLVALNFIKGPCLPDTSRPALQSASGTICDDQVYRTIKLGSKSIHVPVGHYYCLSHLRISRRVHLESAHALDAAQAPHMAAQLQLKSARRQRASELEQ